MGLAGLCFERLNPVLVFPLFGMKRSLVAVYCLTLLTAACQTQKPFVFVQMSDTQIGFIDKSPAYAHSDSLMKAAVDAANALHPAYVFVTGDLVNDPEDPVQESVYRVRLAEVDGIRFITAGPVCNALGQGTPGYNVVEVSADGVKVEYVPTPGVDPTHCVF